MFGVVFANIIVVMASSSGSECFLCGQITGENRTVLGKKGLLGLIKASDLRKDGKKSVFETMLGASVHNNCRKQYTSPTAIKAASKSSSLLTSPSTGRLRSASKEIKAQICIFCEKEIPADYDRVQKRLPTKSRRPISKVSNTYVY